MSGLSQHRSHRNPYLRPLIALTAAVAALAILPATTHAQRLEVFVDSGLRKPLDIVPHPSDNNLFYVVEQGGTIRVVENGKVLEKPFLTIDPDDITDRGWEQGLLGICLAPDFEQTGHFYVNYTAPRRGGRGDPGATQIVRFTASDKRTASFETKHLVLRFDQPYANHNCGNLRFGPDNMLYIGTGDGGGANDPLNAGQDLNTLLGKILRIDPTSDAFPDDEHKNYAIPADNPYANGKAPDGSHAKPEIFAWGIRNPWGMEFDEQGRLWIADVGQNRFEEISIIPVKDGKLVGGLNFGWKIMEGDRPFLPRTPGTDTPDPPPVPVEQQIERGFTPPVWDYAHHPPGVRRVGSVTGGFYYRGSNVRQLRNRYICADFMTGSVWTFRITDDLRADDVIDITDRFAPAFADSGAQLSISAFGEDNDGELIVVDHKAGRLLRIVQ